jgi:hypothetical protein
MEFFRSTGDNTVRKTFARYIGQRNFGRAALFALHRSYLARFLRRIVDGVP